MRTRTRHVKLIAAASIVLAAGCSGPARNGSTGPRLTVRLQQPPAQAAACFARNAEEHSSALVAETHSDANRAETVVRVKNGVLYGTASFERAGSGSNATIVLMVTSTGRRSDLIEALTEGC